MNKRRHGYYEAENTCYLLQYRFKARTRIKSEAGSGVQLQQRNPVTLQTKGSSLQLRRGSDDKIHNLPNNKRALEGSETITSGSSDGKHANIKTWGEALSLRSLGT